MAENNSVRTAKDAKRRARGKGRPFQKGRSGNPLGRPVGSKNVATAEFKRWCREATGQEDFLEYICQKLRNGTLRSDLIRSLWAYAHGRPSIAVDVSMDFDPRAYLARDEEAPSD